MKKTVEQFARYYVEHDDNFPFVAPISLQQAADWIRVSFGDGPVPEGYTPEALHKAYNYYVEHIDDEILHTT